MQDSPLLTRYAQALNLSADAAGWRLFLECVPRWQRGFVRLHCRLRPRLYACDWRLIREAGLATTLQAVDDALDRWQHCAPCARSWGREWFHWRVSGRRLLNVARQSLVEVPSPGGPVERSLPSPLALQQPVSRSRAMLRRSLVLHSPARVRLYG